MALSMQPIPQQNSITIKKRLGLSRLLLATSTLIGMLTLSACQTTPTSVSRTVSSPDSTAPTSSTVVQLPENTRLNNRVLENRTPENRIPVTQAPTYGSNERPNTDIAPSTPPKATQTYPSYPEPSKRQITPNSKDSRGITNPITQPTQIIEPPETIFNEPTIIIPSRDDYVVTPPSTPSPRNALLERARQNSQQQSARTSTDQSDLPAFRNLIQVGINELRSNNLTAAESSFTRAQRLAPRSSAVYFYLSQVALKKNQPRKAEAMARRGLTVSQDSERRRALWQLILQSGQQQNNSRVIREAQQALR
ncbi:tetratricopeptide repeat protein [uncultured Psychrobacter sp.]|uniref:tetratricopeptide repeat protein n=1 Tax=uncultured Psychrobacter sp. TaxID=259303 RepID=UPI00345B36A2